MGHYHDHTLLTGGSGRPVLTWCLLLLAVLADLAAFYAIVALLFRSYPLVVLAATLGFTAASVASAHEIGRGWKQRHRADRRHSGHLWLYVMFWLGLGAAAFLARLYIVPLTTLMPGATSFSGGQLGAVSVAMPDRAQLAAVFFAALYLVSGLLAISASYQGHNPDVAAERRARRAYESACTAREAALKALADHQGDLDVLTADLSQAPQRRADTRRLTDADICHLKNHARLLMGIGGTAGDLDGLMTDAPRPDRSGYSSTANSRDKDSS
jgi:hypothetical protein